MAQAQICLANLKVQQGKAAEAEVLAKQAADEFRAESMGDMKGEARIVLASALLDLERTQDAAKQLDIISGLSSQDFVNKLSVAIIAARLEARAGKPSEARKALASVVSQAKTIGIPGLEFEAQLAQGEIGLYGGDKRAALSLLSNLRKDAANKASSSTSPGRAKWHGRLAPTIGPDLSVSDCSHEPRSGKF